MTLPLGKSPLQSLSNFRVRRWYTRALTDLVEWLIHYDSKRNEVLDGGIVTDGTATATEMMCSMTAMKVKLVGRLMTFAAVVDDDFLDTATVGVGQPIFSDGTTAAGLSLDADETARVTLIVCNSNEAGGATETDNGAPLVVAVVAGTATTYMDATAHLTSKEVQDALDASTGKHDGVTGWAHVAQLLYADTGGASWLVTPTMNRNNAVQGV